MTRQKPPSAKNEARERMTAAQRRRTVQRRGVIRGTMQKRGTMMRKKRRKRSERGRLKKKNMTRRREDVRELPKEKPNRMRGQEKRKGNKQEAGLGAGPTACHATHWGQVIRCASREPSKATKAA